MELARIKHHNFVPYEFLILVLRNGMDLTEKEDIKKRWKEYTEELYKKIFKLR